MTLFNITRPGAYSEGQNTETYRDFVKGFAQAVDKYAADCKNTPSVNIIEEEQAYRVQIVAPGFTKEEFSINVEKDILTVTVEAVKKEEKKEEKILLNEFIKCDFVRSFTLGKMVNSDDISAEFTNGILNITIAKSEEAKVKPPRSITVG